MNGEVACGELGNQTKSFRAEDFKSLTEPDTTIAGEIGMGTACVIARLCLIACVCVLGGEVRVLTYAEWVRVGVHAYLGEGVRAVC